MDNWNEPKYNVLNDTTLILETVESPVEEQWDRNKIKQLLTLYLEKLDKFKNPKIMKKNLWDEIGIVVGKTGECCDKKFRNLKQTYIRLLKRKKQTGKYSVKWPYFDIFNEIFYNDADLTSEPEIIIIQSLAENAQTNESVPIKRRQKPIQKGAAWTTCTVPTRKRKFENIYKFTDEVKVKQKIIEDKLDKIISVLEESNNIQRERNALFQQYLERISKQ